MDLIVELWKEEPSIHLSLIMLVPFLLIGVWLFLTRGKARREFLAALVALEREFRLGDAAGHGAWDGFHNHPRKTATDLPGFWDHEKRSAYWTAYDQFRLERSS